MQDSTLVILAVAAVVVIALVAWAATRKRRTTKLVGTFGPEYDRTVETLGSKAKAEADLAARAKHRAKLTIRPLSAADHDRFADSWHRTQEGFVDDPKGAVARADSLVAEVMGLRGYPMGEFEQQAADISVDYPTLVENYRAAHRLAVTSARGDIGTEDLRQAMGHYRALFAELLEARELEPAAV
jgi:hypothetical protein